MTKTLPKHCLFLRDRSVDLFGSIDPEEMQVEINENAVREAQDVGFPSLPPEDSGAPKRDALVKD